MNVGSLSREERLRRVGCPEQVYGVRAMQLTEGRGNGCALWEAESGAGLTVDVLPDSGLDLGRLRYKGVNMSFLVKNGYVGQQGYTLDEFPRNFFGGMMYTCGLMSTGADSTDESGRHAPHGRIHYISSENRFCRVDEEKRAVVMGGRLREAQLFDYALQVDRTITLPIGENCVLIEDVISNTTPRDTGFMVLYHCNFGYPFLSEALRLVLPQGTKTTPRTPRAAEGMHEFCQFTPPQDVFAEQVYFHDLPESEPAVRLINEELGIGASLEYDRATTPILVEWKNMLSTDYVLGLEPSNSYILGRTAEKENGTLPVIPGFGSVKTRVKLSFFDL